MPPPKLLRELPKLLRGRENPPRELPNPVERLLENLGLALPEVRKELEPKPEPVEREFLAEERLNLPNLLLFVVEELRKLPVVRNLRRFLTAGGAVL